MSTELIIKNLLKMFENYLDAIQRAEKMSDTQYITDEVIANLNKFKMRNGLK